MKCWNCQKEIPDEAKSCSYCERRQDREPVDPEAFKEALKSINTAEPGFVDQLRAIAERYETAEDFANAILSGDCPACGSEETETCEDVLGIENIMVGRCVECGKIFCTECGQAFENDVVTISSSDCPSCGSSDTDYPTDEGDEEDDGWEPQGVVTCHSCGADYCFTCGKPLTADDNVPDSTAENRDLL